jgi:hypothetical protein
VSDTAEAARKQGKFPGGPFYGIYRVYMPGETVLNGTWKKPQMQAVPGG